MRRSKSGKADINSVNTRRRTKYLFFGLTKCACCSGGYSAISATLIGCSTARNKGTCDNRVNIRRDALETRVLNALRTKLVNPDLFAEFCDAYTKESNRLRMESRAAISAAEAEIGKIDREVQKLMDLYLEDALTVSDVKERGDQLRARKAEFESFLSTADEPPTLLHPNMALQYRASVPNLYDALQGEDEGHRVAAADVILSLVNKIVLTPVDGKIEIDVQGDLSGILTLSSQKQDPATRTGS